MARLHVFADDKVPDELLDNVTGQIPQIRPVPKRLDEFTPEEIQQFPKLWELPKDYAVKSKTKGPDETEVV